VSVAPFWEAIAAATHLTAAGASLLAAAWLLSRRKRVGPASGALVATLFATALWALLVAATGGESAASGIAEAVRNVVMLAAVYRLFAHDGRHASVSPVRPVVFSLVLVEALLCALLAAQGEGWSGSVAAAIFQADMMFRLLATIGGLVLVQNLHSGASPQARLVLRWPAAGIAALWLFDFQLYTVGYLLKGWPAELASLQGLAGLALAGLVALGGARKPEQLRLQPSRAVAFQSISLVAMGLYLLAMTSLGQWLAGVGGDFARVLQFTVVVVAAVVALLVVPSARLRGWLRVTLVKHLFRHRYDYRQEWLRFTRTIGRGDEAMPLEERVVQAVADITDSPAGLLLIRDDEGALVLAARWRWPTAEVPGIALDAAAIRGSSSPGRSSSSKPCAVAAIPRAPRLRSPNGCWPKPRPGRLCRCSILTAWSARSSWPDRPMPAGSTGRISTCSALSASSWRATWPSMPGRRPWPRPGASTTSTAASPS
jgi:hypothetical protein